MAMLGKQSFADKCVPTCNLGTRGSHCLLRALRVRATSSPDHLRRYQGRL